LDHLEICDGYLWKGREHIVYPRWLELLYSFASVQDLVISKDLVQFVIPALKRLTQESVTRLLPVLQNIFLDDPQPPRSVQKAVRQFIAARQLCGRPVNIHCRDGEGGQYVRWEVNNR
jgi:hypothetical protein